MKLVIYDFDGTIFKSPDRLQGKKIYKKATGENLKFSGWWQELESLMPPIVLLFPNQTYFVNKVVQNYRNQDKNSKIVLMTGRPVSLKDRILQICDSQNIIFDEHYFAGQPGQIGNNTLEIKKNFIKNLLNANLSSVEIYEDRTNHVIEFCNFAKKCLQEHKNLQKICVYSVVEDQYYKYFQENNDFT